MWFPVKQIIGTAIVVTSLALGASPALANGPHPGALDVGGQGAPGQTVDVLSLSSAAQQELSVMEQQLFPEFGGMIANAVQNPNASQDSVEMYLDIWASFPPETLPYMVLAYEDMLVNWLTPDLDQTFINGWFGILPDEVLTNAITYAYNQGLQVSKSCVAQKWAAYLGGTSPQACY